MTALDIVLILLAGTAAGAINAIVGSGSLLTFPVLLFAGFPPLVANVSNTVGLMFGSWSGVIGYRRALAGQDRRLLTLPIGSAIGAVAGAGLLLVLPSATFTFVVPWLILAACLLVAAQPRISAWLRRRHDAAIGAIHRRQGGPVLGAGVFATGIYGGYFGAAQGVILTALLMISIDDDIQRLVALKNVLAATANTVAALIFLVVAPVDLPAAGLLAISSIVGGQIGAFVGQRLPPMILRSAIVVIGVVVAVRLLVG
jgi:uncharacterized membrane protein YfcA